MTTIAEMPADLKERFLALVTDAEGKFHVKDRDAFFAFVKEYGVEYPELKELVTVNLDAVRQHHERTGEVPAGIKAVGKGTIPGTNVTELTVVHGPASTKEPR